MDGMEPNATASACVEEDLEFQLRSWRIQRLGWCAFALYVAAAALGLLGNGALAGRRVEKNAYSLAYQSPWNNGRNTRLFIGIKREPGVRRQGSARSIEIRGDLAPLRDLRFTPEAISLMPRQDSIAATFDPEVEVVSIEAVAGRPGRIDFSIGVDGDVTPLAVWILP
jgi:hypothetical protein